MTDERLQVKRVKQKPSRRKKWDIHKRESLTLAEAMELVDPDKAERIRNCATEFTRETYEDGSERYLARNCRARLCSVCSWRRSEKTGVQTFQVADAILQDHKDYRFIMLTLTQRNCLPEELDGELDRITYAFRKMIQGKAFKSVVKGFCRSIEITHNLQNDTYHPHIHAILVVHRNYFTGEDYLLHEQWAEMWQRALKVDYLPNVDVRRVRGDLAKAVAEVSKYSVKSADYVIPDQWEFTVATVRLLNSVLHKRRFFAFGGVMKDYHKKLNLSEPDDPEEDKLEGAEPVKVEHYAWFDSFQQYRKVDFI